MIKQNNIISLNLSQKAMASLQVLGFHNGKKQNTGKRSISNFMSQLLIDFVDSENPKASKYVREKVLVSKLKELQTSRDKLENEMQQIATELSALRHSNGLTE